MTAELDDELVDWATIADQTWPTLLLGNGVSINLWSDFRYDSLFDNATLSAAATEIFSELDTANFEAVLECIHHARLVVRALNFKTDEVDAAYAEVRDALFDAVNDVHVGWSQFPFSSKEQVAKTLNEHESVFTTNYDLCLYWSHLENRHQVNLVDFFWGPGNTFDEDDTALHSSSSTAVRYLHGAIHLWQDDDNANGKWTNADGGNLLLLSSNYSSKSSRRPLFISEGTSKDKKRGIQRSPYLTFCLDALREDVANAVVIGHSLSAQDDHIVAALQEGPKREIAVALYPQGDADVVIQEKARIRKALRRHTITFFDSTTHPLGDPLLTIR